MGSRTSGTLDSRSRRDWSQPRMDRPQVAQPQHSHVMALARDVIKLADLQLQMFTLDVREFWSRAKISSIVLVLGAVTALGTIPVMLLGLARLLATAFDVPIAWMQAGVGAFVLIFAVVLMRMAVSKMSDAGQALKRSQVELHKNLEWMREVLHRDESQQEDNEVY
ncbi:MAG: phage holin family protein [Rubinisphaera brasiliensis]|nr:phage holin family protein [Rubinisphaera brasiliensis]MBR9804331.1 phage holin family protein [bacterium]